MNSVKQEGFTIIPDVIGTSQISDLVHKLSGMELNRTRAGVRHALKYPVFTQFAQDERLLAIAKEILGGTAVPFRATLFDKSPDSNWLVVWHQDTALPLRARQDTPGWGPWSVKDGVIYAHAPARVLDDIVALRLHLDDSVAENGPLRVLPGTHRMGVLDDAAIHDLAQKITPDECMVPRGGVLAMRPLTVHASSKSHSGLSRRVLHIEYAASTTIAADELELAIA